jgi:hypothetical protein
MIRIVLPVKGAGRLEPKYYSCLAFFHKGSEFVLFV